MSCGGCSKELPPRIHMIRKVLEALVTGHNGVASLYESIGKDIQDPDDSKLFLDEALRHRGLARECEKIVVPEGVELEGVSEVKK